MKGSRNRGYSLASGLREPVGTDSPDTIPSFPVTQVQTTLASVQELLRQQQQKVQELAHELAAAKVLISGPRGPLGLVCPV